MHVTCMYCTFYTKMLHYIATCKTNLLYYIIFNNVYGIVSYFSEFYKWAYYLGKFILGCYMKFDFGSLL